jgi:hypothetical protein
MLTQHVVLRDECKQDVIMVEGANTRYFAALDIDLDALRC